MKNLHDEVKIQIAQYHNRLASYYTKTIFLRQFQVNDLVLRESAISMPTVNGKLKSSWEGPYKVIKAVRPGTYELAQLYRTLIKNMWNAAHPRKFIQLVIPGGKAKGLI